MSSDDSPQQSKAPEDRSPGDKEPEICESLSTGGLQKAKLPTLSDFLCTDPTVLHTPTCSVQVAAELASCWALLLPELVITNTCPDFS